jgi:Icc-related predicted phosphoesterase
MRIVCISDTHGHHKCVRVPDGDVLIHAGDLTNGGDAEEIKGAMQWLSELPHRHKIAIAGNHDGLFESDPKRAAALVPPSVHYLEDSGCTLGGLRFWGSPVQPWFLDLAFNRARGDDIDRHWQMIPEGTDVLVTHGPPYGKLDRIGNTERGGCEMLRSRVLKVRPRLHVFGHLHDGYGTDFLSPTMLVNASICNESGRPTRNPIVVDL